MKNIDTRETQVESSEADSEFEFSRGLVSKVVPYADVERAQLRTWKRLSSSSKRDAESTLRRTLRLQPSVLAAAILFTFVGGVWVGKRERGLSTDEPRVSPEPVAVGRTTPSQEVGEPGIEQPLGGTTPNSELATRTLGVDGFLSSSSSDKLSRPNARGRSQNSSVVGAPRDSTATIVQHGVVEPVGSVGESVVLSPTAGQKSETQRATWHVLANQGEYEAALVEIAQAGGYERVLERANPEQLMLLSDVARATGQQQRALAALRRIVNEHSADPVAPLAALNMGNLLDKMGDGSGATQAFARYRALSPKGEFAEDALVRQLRSAVKAGKGALAHKLVRQYEADFPDGRSATEVAELAQQVSNIVPEPDAGP